ncbi:MAG: radical SAM family heme chaperone HemW [Legionella sp.]|nr:radical SAM family heme chaperone HemW [Legionella sp.]
MIPDHSHLKTIPTALYVHIPWCVRKCPYCDFNSHKAPSVLPESSYIKALLADFKRDFEDSPTHCLHSIFIGGGTPSLFGAAAYEHFFEALQKWVPFDSTIEITLEANPGTIDQVRFRDYRQLGINRLSLGIQSFNAKHLKALGRIHDDDDARRAIHIAREAGFDNINLDLMYGLPEQTVADGLHDIQTALSHRPEHLSWYQLTLEPNTVFYKRPPPLPLEHILSTLETEGRGQLAGAGFEHYEVSAFSQPNRQAQHNLNYWLFGDYYGIGAGAHGKLTDPTGKIYRTQKHRQPNQYLAEETPFLTEKKDVSTSAIIFEFMLNTTRLYQPIPFELFEERTSLPSSLLRKQLEPFAEKGWIQISDRHWQMTSQGHAYANELLVTLV